MGNAEYEDSPLANPVNDARLMAKTLRSVHFDVMEHTNLDKSEMQERLQQFGDKIAGGVALLYFAGHGVEVDGTNYMIPARAKIQRMEDIPIRAVPVDEALTQMTGRKSRMNIVILDACRNNPFGQRTVKGRGRALGGGLAQVNAPTGTLIAFATGPGKVAADGEGENGTYTKSLARFMAQPGLKVEDVFKSARQQVLQDTADKQVPWENSSIVGDFYFVPPSAGTACSEGSRREGDRCVALAPVADSQGLSIRVDAKAGGTLCAGERFQVSVTSSRGGDIRVFNLFGKDQALLIFPNEERTSGRIEPGQTIPIGGKLGFEATPFPGFDGERYLVIAADSEAGLGVWGRASGTCRVAPASAAALHAAQGLPNGTESGGTS
jgi:hypothetical protein